MNGPTRRNGLQRWRTRLGGVLVVVLIVAVLTWGWGELQRRLAVMSLIATLSGEPGSRPFPNVRDAPALDAMAGQPDLATMKRVRRLRAEPLAVHAVAQALRGALDRGDEPRARGALAVLDAFDALSRPALPAILLALDAGPSSRVRLQALALLMRLGPNDPETVPTLTRALLAPLPDEGPPGALAVSAADALGTLGPRSASAVPILSRLLADPDPSRRDAAVAALGQIGPLARPATQRLIRLLNDPNSSAFTPAAVALSRIAPDDPAVLKVLEPLILDPHPDVQAAARAVIERHESGATGSGLQQLDADATSSEDSSSMPER